MAQTNKSKEIQNVRVQTKKIQENLISNEITPAKIVVDKKKLQKDYDMTPVTGTFRFTEVPGGTLNFTFGKHKGTNKDYSLVDGKVYTIPRCAAKHLKQTGRYPIHEYQTDINGVPIVRVGRMKIRYSFNSLDSFDDSDTGIVTAVKL